MTESDYGRETKCTHSRVYVGPGLEGNLVSRYFTAFVVCRLNMVFAALWAFHLLIWCDAGAKSRASEHLGQRQRQRYIMLTLISSVTIFLTVSTFHTVLVHWDFMFHETKIMGDHLHTWVSGPYDSSCRCEFSRQVLSRFCDHYNLRKEKTHAYLLSLESKYVKVQNLGEIFSFGVLNVNFQVLLFNLHSFLTRCSAIAERPRCRVRYSLRQK